MSTTKKPRMSRRHFLFTMAGAAAAGVVAPGIAAPAAPKKTKILWWSHWAEEVNKRNLLIDVAKAFMAKHPDVEIEQVWWDKTAMFPTMRNAFTAGSGFPDIFYFDMLGFAFIPAGWVADLSGLNWGQVEPWAREMYMWAGPGGKVGNWGVPIEVVTDEIIYSKPLFAKLGIEIPKSLQFSAEDFYQVVKKIRAAGYDPFSQGVGDRDFPGTYITSWPLLATLGEKALRALWSGKTTWKTPEIRGVLEYAKRLIDVPCMPATFSSMGNSERHIYFHTRQKAAMFLGTTAYAARTFSPPEKGGQPPDFRSGFLKYPAMPNGKGNQLKLLVPNAGISVAEKSPNKQVAMDLLQSMMTEEFGNRWLAGTAVTTGLKTDPSKIASPFKWYLEEYAKSHQGQEYAVGLEWHAVMPPAMVDAYGQVVNAAFPARRASIDEVIEAMERARPH
jgi:multiple sugar transport system substrate-binding protein